MTKFTDFFWWKPRNSGCRRKGGIHLFHNGNSKGAGFTGTSGGFGNQLVALHHYRDSLFLDFGHFGEAHPLYSFQDFLRKGKLFIRCHKNLLIAGAVKEGRQGSLVTAPDLMFYPKAAAKRWDGSGLRPRIVLAMDV